jgi:signal peptidase I
MKSFFVFVFDTVKIFIIALAIVIPIRYFLFQPFFVKGASMVPTFENGQYLIIDELSYRLRAPERGEVIVFKYPNDPSQKYIKRIIGLPREELEIKDGEVFINKKQLDESSYFQTEIITTGNIKINLAENEYFVLGDNRPASSDSRVWGVVPKENIIGKVALRAWPFDAFSAPLYQN